MENVILNVNGMTCGHCVKAVETSVGALAGVQEVKVDLAEKKVAVAYNEDTVTVEQIKETIDEQGYDVV
ncbi:MULTISPECIES: copper chaperone CopZ [Solibacillus]|uniref:Copper chaperone CopZ n=1 Tax=Solibacillus faecavium TaxID=2762221 RepID=A0ABR8XWA8_9BACL|nr:copper chaperone CopZ [Solibacillus faecavium]MBD8036225.1 copper chaperone CopZ [Solibacillus faecavium]